MGNTENTKSELMGARQILCASGMAASAVALSWSKPQVPWSPSPKVEQKVEQVWGFELSPPTHIRTWIQTPKTLQSLKQDTRFFFLQNSNVSESIDLGSGDPLDNERQIQSGKGQNRNVRYDWFGIYIFVCSSENCRLCVHCVFYGCIGEKGRNSFCSECSDSLDHPLLVQL